MKKKHHAKALLQERSCDNCEHYAIEFNGIESCVVGMLDILQSPAADLPAERACERWSRLSDSVTRFKQFINKISGS